MLLGIVVAGWLALVQQASLTCSNVATAQTQSVRGPAGTIAVLKVSTEDDHGKNSHLCMADYQLLITRNSDQPQSVDLLSSDDEWGRSLSIQLSGFSHDGKRILGMFSEGSSNPIQQVFDYSSDDGTVQLFDLRKLAAHAAPSKCLSHAQIVGTVESGGIVIQLKSGKYCENSSRWVLNSARGPLRHLSKHASVQDLYGSGSDAY
jgi:hypothetical protein